MRRIRRRRHGAGLGEGYASSDIEQRTVPESSHDGAAAVAADVRTQHDLRNSEVVGIDASFSWVHSRFGYVAPSVMGAFTGRPDYAVEFAFGSFTLALDQMRMWRDGGTWPPHARLVVRLRPEVLADERLAVSVRAMLVRAAVDPGHLVVHVAGHALGTSTAVVAVRQLGGLGIQVAIGSLSLRQIDGGLGPVTPQFVHIEEAWVRCFGRDPIASRRVLGTLVLADRVGARVVAEGIETSAQARELAELGCAIGVGPLYGETVPIEVFGAGLPEPPDRVISI